MWAPPEGAAERYAAAVLDTFSGMEEERKFAAARRAGLISLLVVDMTVVSAVEILSIINTRCEGNVWHGAYLLPSLR